MIPAEFDFRVRVPGPPVDGFVQRVWYARGTSPHGRERILPSAAPVLLVVLGAPLRMSTSDELPARPERTGVWLQGPHERPILNEPTGETHAVGVVFAPGGVAPCLEGSVEELANRILRSRTCLPGLATCPLWSRGSAPTTIPTGPWTGCWRGWLPWPRGRTIGSVAGGQ